MDQYDAVIKLLVDYIKSADTKDVQDDRIPIGISNRHIHLSKEDMEALFGPGYVLYQLKELSQPGQYACRETVTICGPRGAIEKVRILGPVRNQTQVELLAGDCIKLGIRSEIKLSGDLAGTPGITIIGPEGSVQVKEGVIVAQRHIHMLPDEAKRFGVFDGQEVKIQTDGIRGGTYHGVAIRVTEESSLEMHIDVEEANAFGITAESAIRIIA